MQQLSKEKSYLFSAGMTVIGMLKLNFSQENLVFLGAGFSQKQRKILEKS